MELKDFSEKEQQEIRKGLSTAEITDRGGGGQDSCPRAGRMDPEDSVLCTQACDDKDDRKDCRAVSGIICRRKETG